MKRRYTAQEWDMMKDSALTYSGSTQPKSGDEGHLENHAFIATALLLQPDITEMHVTKNSDQDWTVRAVEEYSVPENHRYVQQLFNDQLLEESFQVAVFHVDGEIPESPSDCSDGTMVVVYTVGMYAARRISEESLSLREGFYGLRSSIDQEKAETKALLHLMKPFYNVTIHTGDSVQNANPPLPSNMQVVKLVYYPPRQTEIYYGNPVQAWDLYPDENFGHFEVWTPKEPETP